jgi:hypothetical protein
MQLVQANYVAQTGPKIPADSVRVYASGRVLRITADIIDQIGLDSVLDEIKFSPYISNKTVVLKYDPNNRNALKTWRSSAKSRSLLLSVSGLLPRLGLSLETSYGDYRAWVKGNDIYIDFSEKV